MNKLPVESKQYIFIIMSEPASLAEVSKEWNEISNDTIVRARWLVYHYGKPHALFYAFKRGSHFLNEKVLDSIFAIGVIPSRYFVQRMMLSFGNEDSDLIMLKIESQIPNIIAGNVSFDYPAKKQKWVSEAHHKVVFRIINKAIEMYGIENCKIRGNDMELFHFLSGGPFTLSNAREEIKKKYKLLVNLIKKYHFTPFPPQPRNVIANIEEYPSRDGYENNRQMNVIARAILLEHELINAWKEIGYYNIISDTNDLVIQGQFLICYPPNSDNLSNYDTVYERINTLCNLGYKINIQILYEILHLFESRISLVGDDILKISSKMINTTEESIILSLFEFSIFAQYNFTSIRDYFVKKQLNLKNLSLGIFERHISLTFQLLKDKLQRKYNDDFYFNFYKIMPFERTFLIWILNTYDTNSDIVKKCFDYILHLRVIVNVFGNLHDGKPRGFTDKNVEYVRELFLAYVSCNVPFEEKQLDLIQICSDEEILRSFFDHFLFFKFDTHVEPMIIISDYFQINFDKIRILDKGSNNLEEANKWKDILSFFVYDKYFLCNIEFKVHNNFINYLNKIKSVIRN